MYIYIYFSVPKSHEFRARMTWMRSRWDFSFEVPVGLLLWLHVAVYYRAKESASYRYFDACFMLLFFDKCFDKFNIWQFFFLTNVSDRKSFHDSFPMYCHVKESASCRYFDACFMYIFFCWWMFWQIFLTNVSDWRWHDSLSMY